jgi:hypothetical protein
LRGDLKLEFILVDFEDLLDSAALRVGAVGDPFPGERVQVVRGGGGTAEGVPA